MLVKVCYLDCDAAYAYALPRADAVINTDDIVSAVPTKSYGSGEFLLVNLRNGTHLTIVGTVDDLLAKETVSRRGPKDLKYLGDEVSTLPEVIEP